MKLILASQSPYRKAQLTQLGISFETKRPSIDEEELKVQGPDDLIELTRFLAFHKAQSLRAQFPDAIILGSDQIAECGGHRLDKPGTVDRAIEQLTNLQGRTHRLLTSLVVASPESVQTFTNIATIEMHPLTTEDIAAYVHKDNPLDCAGSYKIERAGLTLVKSLACDDMSAIQGLPILSLCIGLRKLGLTLPEMLSTKQGSNR